MGLTTDIADRRLIGGRWVDVYPDSAAPHDEFVVLWSADRSITSSHRQSVVLPRRLVGLFVFGVVT